MTGCCKTDRALRKNDRTLNKARTLIFTSQSGSVVIIFFIHLHVYSFGQMLVDNLMNGSIDRISTLAIICTHNDQCGGPCNMER